MTTSRLSMRHRPPSHGTSSLVIIGVFLIVIGLTGLGVYIWTVQSSRAGNQAQAAAPNRVAEPVGAVAPVEMGRPDPTITGVLPTGRWRGMVVQPGYPAYEAELQLDGTAGSAPTGTMSYATLGCTALLTFVKRNGGISWFQESIQDGRGKCQDGGMVSIAQTANEALAWKYYMPGNLNVAIASAILKR